MSLADLPSVESVKRKAVLRRIKRKPWHQRTAAENRFLFTAFFSR